jgi:hypothetical protein
MNEKEKRDALAAKWAAKVKVTLHPNGHPEMPTSELEAAQGAPRTAELVQARGPELAAAAIRAWDARVRGEPIVDVAHQLGLSIAAAKTLVREAHDAIREDLKEALELNREIDLARTDQLIKAYLPEAKEGDDKAATIVLKALSHRARLVGISEQNPDPNRARPENVLVWIQAQLPSINKIVDSMPIELER